jgi:hypothetical protein
MMVDHLIGGAWMERQATPKVWDELDALRAEMPDATVLGEVAFAVRAMLSKKRRELAKLEGKNDADEHLPSMRSRLERLEQGHKWLNSLRGKSWERP